MGSGTELIPGWELKVEEVSNCVWKAFVKHERGAYFETTMAGGDPEEAIAKCREYAMEIERLWSLSEQEPDASAS